MTIATRKLTWLTLSGVAVTLILHYVWEMLHAPLFVQMQGKPWTAHAWRCVSATLGDLVIATVAYLCATVVAREMTWPLAPKWLKPAIVFLAAGFCITVAFEVWAVRVGRWQYTQRMPTIAGVGVSPLIQWVLIPVVTLGVWRCLASRTSIGRGSTP